MKPVKESIIVCPIWTSISALKVYLIFSIKHFLIIFVIAIIEAAAKNQFKDEDSYEDYINQRVTKVLRHNNFQKFKEMSEIAKNAKIHCAVLGKINNTGRQTVFRGKDQDHR